MRQLGKDADDGTEMTYHMEALIRISPCLVPRYGVYACLFPGGGGCFSDLVNGGLELLIRLACYDGMMEIVSEVVWAYEKNIYAFDFCNRFNLYEVTCQP